MFETINSTNNGASIVDTVREINNRIKEIYLPIKSISKNKKREYARKFLGDIVKIEPMDNGKLSEINSMGGIVCVDGSTNRYGGAFPHYMDIFKAVAIIGGQRGNISVTDGFSPLVEDVSQEDEHNIRDIMLAAVELKVALEALKNYSPKMIMMDGSLIRFAILATEYWEQLKSRCLERDILLIGVIEDIKTRIFSEKLIKENILSSSFFDREMLYNMLEIGECLIIKEKDKDEIVKGKAKYGLSSGFFRPSNDPSPIGIDLLEEQRGGFIDVLSLCSAITSTRGRGIPFILDMVDKEARITNLMMEEAIKSNTDIDIYEIVFNSQRGKRNI